MGRVILVHANCVNSHAKGDYAFAGEIATDLIKELQQQQLNIDVILVSTLEGINGFHGLYGQPINGRVNVHHVSIGLSSLEEFDAVEHTVIGFVFANKCKISPADSVKRVLAPESKFLYIGNLNQPTLFAAHTQKLYLAKAKSEQPGLYQYFDDADRLVGATGFGDKRLGIPKLIKSKELPDLTQDQQVMLPSGDYGFMYLSNKGESSYQTIVQYMMLTGHSKYVLLGGFSASKALIKQTFDTENNWLGSKPTIPNIAYYSSLPYALMRVTAANAKGSLVVATGVLSTLEAMRDDKLPFYQYSSVNEHFVDAYLKAVRSIISNDTSLFGVLPHLIIELSTLLFAEKPLPFQSLKKTQELLSIAPVVSYLKKSNQDIIEQANGKIAPRVLGFLHGTRSTHDALQLVQVCTSLRKEGETLIPIHEQALRRAAAGGRLFELKVLIKAVTSSDLDKRNNPDKRAALHWAVINGHLDCARALVFAGASVNMKDKEGRTPLHLAVCRNNKLMIKLLIEAGASLTLPDKENRIPEQYVGTGEIAAFINTCKMNNAQEHNNLNF